MLLEGKTAIVFGAAGYLGTHIAESFSAQGAQVFVAGSNVSSIISEVSFAGYSELDVTNETEVDTYLDNIVNHHEKIDILVNVAAASPIKYHHGHPANEVSLEQFLLPLSVDTAGQFITAKSVFRHMSARGEGVIIFSSSTLAKVGSPWSPAATAAHAATEGLMRSLAHEWGSSGVRVLGVRSEAMPDSPTIEYTFKTMGGNIGLDYTDMKKMIEENKTSLKKLPTGKNTADVFTFAASDLAACMAGTTLNQSSGHIVD